MKIGIDISRSIEDSAGVGYYAKNLVKGLSQVDSVSDYILYGVFFNCYPLKWKAADIPNQKNFRLNMKSFPFWYVIRKWQKSRGVERNKLLGNVDIIHSTAFTMPVSLDCKVVVTIPDMSFYLFPQFHTEANYQYCSRNAHFAARNADFIITISESSKKDIMRYLHIPDDRIRVTCLAASRHFFEKCSDDHLEKIKKKYSISKPYILTVGSVEPRKNLQNALLAFKLLIETQKSDYQFVIAGGKGWKNEDFSQFLKELNIDSRLILTGYVPEPDLPALYQGSDLFVYPSFYEGFGLPVLEAMASGVPVITSNISSLPEVAGDAAILINPNDIEEIVKAMTLLTEKRNLHAEFVHKGLKQSRKFAWEKTAEQTLDVYREVFRKGKTNLMAMV